MILASPERIQEYTARGWWGRRRIGDFFEAALAARPEATALVDPPDREQAIDGAPRRLSWHQLEREAARFASALLAAGAGKDAVVCVQLPNCVELAIAYIACFKIGAIISPVPVQYREHELEHVLRHSGARVCLTASRILHHEHAAMFVRVGSALGRLLKVLCLGAAPVGAQPLETLLPTEPERTRLAAHLAAHPIDANDIATLCWTSGTESVPKGVPRSHNEWLAIPETMVASANLVAGTHLLNPFPLVNMAGIAGMLLPWLATGGKLVMHHPFKLPVFLQQIRDEAIQYSVAAPAILTQLAQNPALLDGIDFTRFSIIGSGGGPLSDWTLKTLEQRHGLRVINYFGSNEGAALTSGPLDVPDPELRAAFFPRFGAGGHQWKLPTSRRIRTRLVDPDREDEIVTAGRPGELRVKGPAIFSGYWQAPELTAKAFDADGWYRTGDLFEIAGERGEFYRFVGRHKDIIVRGGFNISSEEIESLLAGHPKVAEVAIVGYPDETLGERACAVVAPRGGAAPSLEELVVWLKTEAKVAAYKLPERLLLVSALPRNPVGKILKRELRATLQDHVRPEKAGQHA